MKKYLIIILSSALCLIIIYSYQTARFSDKTLHVIFCDVGQGDGILIRTPDGVDIVIDGGQKNGKMLKCLSEHIPFWDHDIELMFATHPDADHIGGLVEVLQSYRVISFSSSTDKNLNGSSIFDSLVSEVAKQNIPFRVITSGDRFKLSDGVTLDTLWPIEDYVSDETNSYSLVQKLKYGDFDALLTGDVTYQILDALNINSSFEVFKIPHHGSKTGVDDETMQEIHASFVPISDGYKNRYHHPSPSVLALLKKYNIPYKRTDQVGTIEVITDGKNTKVVTEKTN